MSRRSVSGRGHEVLRGESFADCGRHSRRHGALIFVDGGRYVKRSGQPRRSAAWRQRPNPAIRPSLPPGRCDGRSAALAAAAPV
jgi:hypothetical protein